jgi:hypothetical protein
MLELLVRLECKRQDLISRRFLRHLGESGTSFWGIAGLIFFLFLFPMIISPPVAVAETPPEAVIVGVLVSVGLFMCATIVGAPIGLLLF